MLMTPADAAALLGVGAGAAAEDIERAWRTQARRWHPDLQGALTPRDRVHAAAQFVRVSEARQLLLSLPRGDGTPGAPAGATAPPRAPGGPAGTTFAPTGSSIYGDDGAQPWPNSWLFWTWTGILVVACVVSFLGGLQPYATFDLILRLLPLVFFSTAFALTGRAVFYRAMVIFVLISAALTVVFASFGTLFSLLLLLVPVIGLGVLGMRESRLRAAALREAARRAGH